MNYGNYGREVRQYMTKSSVEEVEGELSEIPGLESLGEVLICLKYIAQCLTGDSSF